MPGKAETGTVEPVVAAESISCVELLDRGVGCAMVVAADKASAEPPLGGYGNYRSDNSVSGKRNRPAAGTAFSSGGGSRHARDEYPPGRAERPLNLIRVSCVRKT